MKLGITKEWFEKHASKEDGLGLDPTTGKPDYIPGFVPSEADRYYNAVIARYASELSDTRSRAEKAEAERYQLALAICGGEDAPGYLDSIPVETIVDVARSNHSSHMNDIDRLMKAEATCEKLAAAMEEALSYEPKDDSCAAWVPDAKAALSAYRNVTTVNASGPKGETPENCLDGGAE